MADNNNIDDLFRKGVESFRMDPPESSWNSLQGKLAKKRAAKIRRRWLGWFSASLLLLTLSYTSYKHFSTKTPATPVVIDSNSEKISENHKQLNEKLEKALGKKGSSNTSTNTNSESVTSNTTSAQSNSSIQNNSSLQNNSNDQISSSNQNKNSVASTSSVKSDDKVSSEKNVNTADSKKQQSTAKNDNKKVAAGVSASASTVKKNSPKSTSGSGINSTSASSATSTSASSATESPASNTNATPQNVTEPASATNNSNSQDNSVIADDEKTPASDNTNQTPNSAVDNNETAVKSEKENSQNKIAAAVVVSSQAPIQNTGQSSVPKSENNSAVTPDNNKPNDASSPSVAVNVPQDSAKNNNDSGKAPANPRDSSISRFKKIISMLSADIYFSPDLVNSRLKPNDTYTGSASQDPADYADAKSEFSFSTGFHVGVDVTKQWSIRSGVSFSTFNQSAIYNTLQVVADSVYQEEHDHGGHGGGHSGGGHGGGGHHGGGNHNHQPPNPNNDHHYVVHTPCGTIDLHHEPDEFSNGSQTAVNGSTFSIKTETHQTIHFIYIPLLVRYQFGQKKLSYFVEGGAALNLVSDDVVKVTINDSYSEENNFDGLNSFNYSLLFGAGVQYNFYKKMNFFLKPSLRYSITPINDTNPLYSYPYYIGLGTGFSIHF